MRKHTKLSASGLVLLLASTLWAGSIDTKSNLSVGYLRNPSRNTESSRPEAVLYNLAGTGFLKEQFSVEVGNQFVFKNYTHKSEVTGTTYEDEEPVILYPNIDMVYRFGDFAISASFQIAAGGGTLDYEDGTFPTTGILTSLGSPVHEVKVSGITYGETLGFAYNYRDQLSLAAGLRFLQATQQMELSFADATLHKGFGTQSFDAFGWGVGGIFGVHYKPMQKLDLALQYKTITKMQMKFEDVDGRLMNELLQEGDKFDNDLPSELNAGVGYQVLDNLYLSASFNYYFNSHADIGSALESDDLDWDDSWETAVGADWKLGDKITLSAGTLYSKQGYRSDVNNFFSPVLNSFSLAAGVEYQALDQLTVTYGAMYTMYQEDDYMGCELDKSVFQMALGATYRL